MSPSPSCCPLPPHPQRAVPYHLRAHVEVGPRLARERGAVVRQGARQAKVTEARHTRGIDEDVGGLHVTVQHGGVARLKGSKTPTHLDVGEQGGRAVLRGYR